ncbi:hypothetical protein D3C87_277120 [compost metagenome]
MLAEFITGFGRIVKGYFVGTNGFATENRKIFFFAQFVTHIGRRKHGVFRQVKFFFQQVHRSFTVSLVFIRLVFFRRKINGLFVFQAGPYEISRQVTGQCEKTNQGNYT